MNIRKKMKEAFQKAKVAPGERVLKKLTESEVSQWEDLYETSQKVASLFHSLQQEKELMEAKKTLFFHMMSASDERAESSDSRGMALGIRNDDDGNVLLVEFDPEKDAQKTAEQFQDFLRGLFGGEHES